MELYLHSPYVFVACCLINEAEGQLYRYLYQVISAKEDGNQGKIYLNCIQADLQL
jgi:hypothetical protein